MCSFDIIFSKTYKIKIWENYGQAETFLTFEGNEKCVLQLNL